MNCTGRFIYGDEAPFEASRHHRDPRSEITMVNMNVADALITEKQSKPGTQ